MTLNRQQLERQYLILREIKIRKARKNFFVFCQLMIPDFYKSNRQYLIDMCNTLQALYEGKLVREDGHIYQRLIINCPPRHGKSLTLTLFTMWCFGQDPSNRVMTASYNEELASNFSRQCRDGISQEKDLPHEIVYSDIFPNVKIKYGDASAQKWSIEGQPITSYKSTSPNGSSTGMGCNISISDDLIKSAEVAYSETALKKINSWYTDTFASRREDIKKDKEGNILRPSIEIICFTRWSSKDLCGVFLSDQNPEKDTWYVLSMKAFDETTGKMLCDDVLSYERYKSLEANMDAAIFHANYNQKEIDNDNRLYKDIKTYEELPKTKDGDVIYDKHITYIDTADTGDDSLVAIDCYIKDGDIFINDVYGSREAMEYTEYEVAEFIIRNKPDLCIVESNNGGRGYMRSIKRICEKEMKYRHTIFEDRPQTKNKEVRILTNSTYLMNRLYMPLLWHLRYKECYLEVSTYKRKGKNPHDDYVDVLTKLCEIAQEEDEINVRFI